MIIVSKSSSKGEIIGGVAGVMLSIGLFAGFLYGLSWCVVALLSGAFNGITTPTTTTIASDEYVIQSFGMEPDKTYPLVLGSLGPTSQTDITAYSSILGGSYFSFSQTTGSAYKFSYTYNDITVPIDISTKVTTFKRVEGVEPTIELIFQDYVPPQAWYDPEEGYGMAPLMITQTVDTECVYEWVGIFWSCSSIDDIITETKETVSEDQLAYGPVPWVDAYLDRAVVTLPPEMYDQLIGVIEPS